MPIYTYRCENCGVQFDRRQKFSDDPLTICPECEVEALRKVYLPVGIVFKGSGFYSTDNRSSSGQGRSGHKPSGGENGSSEEKNDYKSSKAEEKAKSEKNATE
jgi:putative FmdB family regulatory protein